MQSENIQYLYSNKLSSIEQQLTQLQKYLEEKTRIESEFKDRIDSQHKEVQQSLININKSVNNIFHGFFFQEQLAQIIKDLENGKQPLSNQQTQTAIDILLTMQQLPGKHLQ